MTSPSHSSDKQSGLGQDDQARHALVVSRSELGAAAVTSAIRDANLHSPSKEPGNTEATSPTPSLDHTPTCPPYDPTSPQEATPPILYPTPLARQAQEQEDQQLARKLEAEEVKALREYDKEIAKDGNVAMALLAEDAPLAQRTRGASRRAVQAVVPVVTDVAAKATNCQKGNSIPRDQAPSLRDGLPSSPGVQASTEESPMKKRRRKDKGANVAAGGPSTSQPSPAAASPPNEASSHQGECEAPPPPPPLCFLAGGVAA
jgi:hypothetical protein